MTDITAFIGQPLNFKNKFWIYPPKVKDVIGNHKLAMYQKILMITAEDIQDELKKAGKELEVYPTPFEFLLGNCYNNKEFKELTIEAFEFFCHTKVAFLFEEKKIIVGDLEKLVQEISDVSEIIYLLEDEYFDFQNAIRLSIGDKPIKPPEPFNPDEDPRVRRIKEKARERDRIKAKQGVKDGISLSTCLTAICCMGIGITPLNIGEMSYAAVGPIMKTMQDKEKYDIDIRSLLAGASSKKIKPKYWIRNSDKE